MKRVLLLVTLCLSAMFSSKAQTGLQIDSLFLKFTGKPDVAEYVVTGSELKPYNLKYFRSISFKASSETIAWIAKLIEADAKNAADTKIDYQSGQLNYALIRIPVKDSRDNQYIGFQVKGIKSEVRTDGPTGVVTGYIRDEKAQGPFKSAYVTVVCLRGKASMKDLNNMFKKR